MEGLGWQSRIRVVDRIGKALPTLPHSLAILRRAARELPELAEIAKMLVQVAPYLLATSEEAHSTPSWGLRSLATEGKP
jgi:hypothetical protein